MAINLVKTVNFGPSKGGLSTVGYRLYSSVGVLSGSRITAGVGEVLDSSGIYSASIHFASDYNGSILWDTGGSSPVYASEDYNSIEEKIEFINAIEGGRWVLNETTKQMVFYKSDNTTIVAKFGMSGSDGTPTTDKVFQRNRLD